MRTTIYSIIALSVCLVLFGAVSAQEKMRFVRSKVYCNDSQLSQMAAMGVGTDHLGEVTREYIVGEFSEWEMVQINSLGLKSEVLIEDMEVYYRERNLNICGFETTNIAPQGFNYGSMGGYLTLEEVEKELDSLYAQFPTLITSKSSIGNSYEGRPIWMVKISDNPEWDENEPEALFVGLHHAREAITVTEMIYFMQYLLNQYGTDPHITYLLQNRELYFVPIMNPDGYVYNEMLSPTGGGMWRKNRRDNGDGTFGVDLNRNYGFQWGIDDIGSEPFTYSERYRGAEAFSEPETQAIRDFCNSRTFRTALNAHSYGNLLLNPWGYQPVACPDEGLFHVRGERMTRENNYTFGQGPIILYPVNGESNDWMYGEQDTKPKIMSVTPETGTQDDGFWPLQTRILPLCEEMLPVLLDNAWFAGEYLLSKPVTNFTTANFTFSLPATTLNYGQDTANNATVSFVSNDAYVIGGAPAMINGHPPGVALPYNIMVSLSSNTPHNYEVAGWIRTTFSDGYYIDSAVTFTYTGYPSDIEDKMDFAYCFLYPNPSDGKCFVKMDTPYAGEVYLEIFDMQSKVVRRFAVVSKSLDLSTLPVGMYLYRFMSENKAGRIQKLWIE